METQPRDTPVSTPARPGLRRGVWSAIAIGIVAAAAIGLQVTTQNGDSKGSVSVLESTATEAAIPNPLLGAVSTPDDLIGRVMPEHVLEQFDGDQGSIRSKGNNPTVMNLWASNCVPCVTEMPDLEQVHQDYGSRVDFVGIDSGEGIDLGRKRAISTGVTYRLLSDPQGAVAASIGASSIPVTVLVRSDGTIAWARFGGAVDPTELRQHIDQDLLS